MIYNLEFNLWTLQDFLPFNGSVPIKHIISAHVYNDTSCAVLHEKVRTRSALFVYKIIIVVRFFFKINDSLIQTGLLSFLQLNTIVMEVIMKCIKKWPGFLTFPYK